MKREEIASHRSLFCLLIGLFDALMVISVLVIWSDPRQRSPWSDVAGFTGLFSTVSLFVLWWLLRRAERRLASICLVSGLIGILGGMLLPAVP